VNAKPKEWFSKKFDEQLGFLQTSCRLYDQGAEAEALRIALSLRVLFHNTGSSTSLMTHLGLNSVMVVSTKLGAMPLGDHTAFFKIELSLNSPTPVRAIPKLGNEFIPTPLPDWWEKETVFSSAKSTYTRKHLVWAAANQDGGAHVDSNLKTFYTELAAGTLSIGIDGKNLKYSGSAPFDQTQTQYAENIHLAMIRQFGHEVLAAAKHFQWAN
jgi:hypothetical protein